jgi:hypothetical protein
MHVGWGKPDSILFCLTIESSISQCGMSYSNTTDTRTALRFSTKYQEYIYLLQARRKDAVRSLNIRLLNFQMLNLCIIFFRSDRYRHPLCCKFCIDIVLFVRFLTEESCMSLCGTAPIRNADIHKDSLELSAKPQNYICK